MRKTSKTLIRQIEASKKRIAAERDKLRELITEAAAVLESCDAADTALDQAVDALSEFV